MSLSRRDLLAASALLLAGPAAALRAAPVAATGKAPLVLCWNENPYGPAPAARLAVSRAIAYGCRYPSDDDIAALARALATHEGVAAESIVIGSGSGELLRALGLLCAHDSGELVIAEPTYAELPDYARLRGVTVRTVPLDRMLRHDLTAMAAAVNEHTRAVYVCNPNNPTGTALPAAEIRAFITALPEHVVTIVDEAYMDFAVGAGVGTVAELVRERRVIVLRTFSKLHGMAGLRCGYGITRPELATTVAQACMTTPNIFAVRAALASLGDARFLSDTRRQIIASRTRITSALARLKLNYADPQGNFVFFDTGMPLARFTSLMRARNILVGRLFPPFDTWCRISIGTEPEVSAFLAALEALKAERAA
jgi:histidinol-phosphate aminotransferase